MHKGFLHYTNEIKFVFQPMYSKSGNLIAVECLSRFPVNSKYANLTPQYFFDHADHTLKTQILLSQLSLIEKYKTWFEENQVMATLNIDDHSMQLLLDPFIQKRISAIGCLVFEVNENSQEFLSHKEYNDSVFNNHSFWLDDFGSGYSGFSSLFKRKFKYIKLDCLLFWGLMNRPGGELLMDSLLQFLSLNHYEVIIEGVESIDHYKWLAHMPYYALQGKLWKEVDIDNLNHLLTQRNI